MKIVMASVALLVSLAKPAAAQPEPLSEGAALGLSLGTTVVSWSVMVGAGSIEDETTATTVAAVAGLGTLIAPSTGHVYAGQIITRGLVLRGAGLASLGGFVLAVRDCDFIENDCESAGLAILLGLTAVGLYVGGTIDDIVTAPRRVRRHNRARTIQPVITPAGVAIVGRF